MKLEERQKLEKVKLECDNDGPEELNRCIKEFGMKAPETGNELSDATPFNLMFASDIGPTGQLKGFLRPETA